MQPNETAKALNGREILSTFTSLPRILRLVWNASPTLLLSMGLIMLLQGAIPLANVIIARLLIDGALRGISQSTIQPILLPVSLELISGLLSIFCTRLHATFQVLLNHRLSDHTTLLVLRQSSRLDLAFFENAEFYDRLARARENVANKPLLLIMQLFTLGSSLVTVLSLLGLIFQLSWWLALIALVVPIPLFLADSRYGLNNYWISHAQSPRKRQQWYILHLLTTNNYIKEIKLFDIANFFIQRYHTLGSQMYQEDRAIQVKHTWISLLWSTVSILANTGIYLYIALQAVQRRISIGSLTQYTMAVNQVRQSFQSVLDSLSGMYELHLFVDTLFDFLSDTPQIVAPMQPASLEVPIASSGLDIEFRKVSFYYPGRSEATLKNISFKIHAGESVALVGQNGAGKTTLVKLLTRLYDPSEGEILINRRNIKSYDPDELRQHIGVIFQDYIKYHMTVNENIGLGQVTEITNRSRIETAAQKSGAHEIIAGLAEGYDTMLGQWFSKSVDLSGGEWQKIALARAFMRDAPLLILDEPTSALDAQAEHEIFQLIRTLTATRTVVFISHRFSTVRLADHILVIEQGELRENGSHEDLLASGGRYAELFHIQAQAYL